MSAGLNRQSPPEIVILPDPAGLAHEGARRFAGAAASAVGEGRPFRVALSGGSTPKALFETLANEPYHSEVDWTQVEVFFSDERFVSAESPDSNYGMALTALLNRVPIPESFVHAVPTTDITPHEAALLYTKTIRRVFQVAESELPCFDLILLGLGPDGHTASLFPDSDALTIQDQIVAANYVAKFDSWRITFTYPLLNAARCVAFLAQGLEKAEKVQQVLQGDADLPAAGVHPGAGALVWLLDRGAAGAIPPDMARDGA